MSESQESGRKVEGEKRQKELKEGEWENNKKKKKKAGGKEGWKEGGKEM